MCHVFAKNGKENSLFDLAIEKHLARNPTVDSMRITYESLQEGSKSLINKKGLPQNKALSSAFWIVLFSFSNSEADVESTMFPRTLLADLFNGLAGGTKPKYFAHSVQTGHDGRYSQDVVDMETPIMKTFGDTQGPYDPQLLFSTFSEFLTESSGE